MEISRIIQTGIGERVVLPIHLLRLWDENTHDPRDILFTMAQQSDSEIGSICASAENAGSNVLSQNIQAALQVSEFVATTLGPQGRDKIIVNKNEKFEKFFEISNSASFLLKRVSFNSPAAEVVANIAGVHEDRYGDGTCITALCVGQLLDATESLLEEGAHPTTVAQGLQFTTEIAMNVIDDIAIGVNQNDRDILEAVARTTLCGNMAETISDQLASWIVDAVLNVAREHNGSVTVDPDLVQTEAIRAGTLSGTEIVNGMVLKKSYAGQYQPIKIESPTVALVTQAFARQRAIEERLVGGEDRNASLSYDVAEIDKIDTFHDQEVELVADTILPLKQAEVDVVLVEDRVEDELLSYFEQADIAVVRNARKDRMRKVAAATGASINTHLADFNKNDTGTADEITYETIGNQDMLFFRDCAEKDAMALLIRGSTWASGWEVERNVNSAVHAVGTALENGAVIPGGGAVEMQIATELRNQAVAYEGRESLVVRVAAEAFEAIPKQLARNAGLQPMDTVIELRTDHADGNVGMGVLGLQRTTGDAFDAGIVDVAAIKKNGIEMAGGIATTILRIDDIITGIDAEIVG